MRGAAIERGVRVHEQLAVLVNDGFPAFMARWPDEQELTILRELLAAERAATTAESAWTLVASVLLNLDETLSKG